MNAMFVSFYVLFLAWKESFAAMEASRNVFEGGGWKSIQVQGGLDLEFFVTLHGLTAEEEDGYVDGMGIDVEKKEKKKERSNLVQLSISLPKGNAYWKPQLGPEKVKLSEAEFAVGIKEPRGMLQLPSGDMLITQAYSHNSKVWRVSHCNIKRKTPMKEFASHGMHHPYDLALTLNGTVLVSNQNCPDRLCRISQYSLEGVPMGNFATMEGTKESIAFRGVTVDSQGNVYVAARALDRVLRFDAHGNRLEDLKVKKPLALYYDRSMDSVYISSRASQKQIGKRPGAVYQYTISEGRVERKFVLGGDNPMSHPAGIYSYSGALYVLDQWTGRLLAFDIEKGTFLTTVATDIDIPEALMIRTCQHLEVL